MKAMRPQAIRISRLAATSFLFLGLLPGMAFAAKWKTPTEEEKKIVEDPAKGLVGAVYVEKLQETVLTTYHVHVRAKVLSKNGFDIGTVDDLGGDAYDIGGRTISPNGKVTELEGKDIRTILTRKTGGRTVERKGFTMPALEPGCFIEYDYYEHGAFGPDTRYHAEVLFQDKYPVLHQELRTPKNFPFSSSLRLQNGVRIDTRAETNTYVYSAANTPAVRKEAHGLPMNERAAEVIFARVFPGLIGNTSEEFWKNATKTVLVPYIKKWLARPGRVEDALRTLPGSREKEPEARLQAIYRHVQKTVRNQWVLRAGETSPKGGWKENEDAGEALTRGSGNPWDIAFVCASMLRSDGWKFRVVFASDREHRFFRPELPSVFQFEDLLLEVADPRDPAKPTYLSFEHPLLPFGFVPWNDLGVDAFAVNIDDTAGSALRIPLSAGESNARRRAWNVAVTEEGDVRIERKTTWTGQQAYQVRADLYGRGKEALEKETREDYEKLDPPGQVESIAWENEEAPDQELKGTLRLTRKGMAGSLPGGRIEVSPLTMIRSENPFAAADRNGPIYFSYPYVNEDTMEVAPPPGYVLDSLPQSVEQPTSVGRYSVKAVKGAGEAVRVARTFELKRFSAGEELYSTYRRLFEAAARGDAGFSILFKKAPSGPVKK